MTRGRGGSKKLVRVVLQARLLPGKAAQGHAAKDDGQRPNIGGAGIIFLFIVDFRCEVRIRADDSWLDELACVFCTRTES